MSWDTTAVENGGVTDAGKMSAAEWNIMVDAISYGTADYNVYKVGSDYSAKKTTDGSIISTDSNIVTVLNAVSADVSLYGAATISFAGDTVYTFPATSTVTFTDRQVFIDGSMATFNIDASNCSVFFWEKVNFSNHMRGGIRNVQVDGDRTNTNQIFASFYGTCADVYNITTRNIAARAVYNMVLLRDGGVLSNIKDCYIYGEYPIRLLGSAGAGGEASRTVIDHCHLSGADGDDCTRCIDIDYGQYISITNCYLTYCGTGVYAKNASQLRVQNSGIGSYTGYGLDIDSLYATVTGNTFYNNKSNCTDIGLYDAYSGVIADNNFNVNGDDVVTIIANTSKRLSITGNNYCVVGAQSNCTFIKQVDSPADGGAYSNWWTVSGNNITGSGVQTGVCMMFADIRNSIIVNNNIGCAPATGAADGSIPWSEENIRIASERNTIAERYSTASDTYTAVMGEFIEANATGGAFTVTFPTYHTFQGRRTAITVKKTDSSANAITLEGAGSNTLDGALNYALTSQNDCATFESNGLNWYLTSSVSF